MKDTDIRFEGTKVFFLIINSYYFIFSYSLLYDQNRGIDKL